jgi:hypothetical protein
MDPYSRNLEEEELLEEIIKDAPDVEPAKSPSSYLNPSGDGMEADGAGDDEADGHATMKPTGQAIALMMEKAIAPLMEKPVDMSPTYL